MCHSESSSSLSTKQAKIWLVILNMFFLVEMIMFMSADMVFLASIFAFIFIVGVSTLFSVKRFRSILLVYITSIGLVILLQCALLMAAFNNPEEIRAEAKAEFSANMHKLKLSLRSKSGRELIDECQEYKYAASVYKCCDFSSQMLRDACCPPTTNDNTDNQMPSCSYSYFVVNFWMMTGFVMLMISVKVFILTIAAIIRSKNKLYQVRTYQELEEVKLKSGFDAL